MNWWEDAEARARRAKSPAALALTLQQRLQAAGINMDLAHAPAYDLAQLYSLCADLVLLIEGILLAADGDQAAIGRQSIALSRWGSYAHHWAEASAPAFNHLMDSLDLDTAALAERDLVEHFDPGVHPEEQSKVDGRYRFWHLLYERLDLKFASAGLDERVHRGLARTCARLYEESLVTIRVLGGLEKEPDPRFRPVARLLLDLNTTWHFDLGPYHLGHGRLRGQGAAPIGLQTWLLLAFGNPR